MYRRPLHEGLVCIERPPVWLKCRFSVSHQFLVTVLISGRICDVLQVEPRTKRPGAELSFVCGTPRRRGAAAYGVAYSAPMTARSTLLEVKSAGIGGSPFFFTRATPAVFGKKGQEGICMDLQGGRTPFDRFGHSGPSCGIFKDSTALLVRANPNQTRRDHLELHDF